MTDNKSADPIVRRVGVFLGARVSNIDLSKPVPELDAAILKQAHAEHGVLVFPDQQISSDDLKRFGRLFGDLTVHPFSTSAEESPELIVYDNKEGNPPAPTDIWHTDETFRECPPMGTALCSKIIPEHGGDTAFCSMSAVWEGLSDRWQSFLSGLEAVHDFKPFRGLFDDSKEGKTKLRYYEDLYPPVTHPVVRVHPITKKKAIFVNPQFTLRIKDMADDESDHDPEDVVWEDTEARVPVQTPLGAEYGHHLGQPPRPALGSPRLLPIAAPDGKGDNRR